MTENEQERVYVLYCTCGGIPITEVEFEQIKFILVSYSQFTWK